MSDRELMNTAMEAAKMAYVPYSSFPVGAALECEDGKVFTGCNVENAAYGGTICAERTAVCKAVSEGHRKFKRIAVWGKSEDYCWPCGACRQFLAEFGLNIRVLTGRGDGEFCQLELGELLPHTFTSDNLDK